ncbi:MULTISPECIES: capsular biosynthesis protein [Leclercia]|uniref:capsular biosynthesis protein n=1 Tax=Leclercia TaxID=83654 RepID=UPI0012E84CB8|nr:MULTISPECIES: capsular biosynthesis protein [Leclercia]QGW15303.1 capsular biosynthesis protein [Leclercia sp. Colony189]URM23268.1 capsular biosynthesis protein [Leclercia adecarboxylata]
MNLNTGHYLQTFTLLTLIFIGLVQYFTGELAVLWLPFFMTMLMAGFLVLQTRHEPVRLDAQEAIVLTLYLSFIVLAGISTLFQGGALITLIGFKNEIALSLVMLCLLLGFCRESQIYQVTRGLYWIFYIQFPVAFYQLLFVVPQRVALHGEEEKWDSVVGTFGGDPMGGGNTAAMGLFCLLIMLLKVSEYKHGLTSFKNMALHIALGFVMCIIGEVKFVILLSPLLLGWVWLMPSWVKEASRVNLAVLLSILVAMVLLIGLAIVILAYSYTAAYGIDMSENPFTVFFGSLSYIFDPNFILPGGEIGRFTTLTFWLQHNDLSGLPGTLFGYGLNATNSGSFLSPGFLNQVYNLILDSTAMSMLLWEVGVVGTLIFIGLFVYILKVVQPEPLLSVDQIDKQDLQLLSFAPAFNVFAIACLLSLPYSQILMIVPMLQFLFYLSLGSSLIIRRTVRRYTGLY